MGIWCLLGKRKDEISPKIIAACAYIYEVSRKIFQSDIEGIKKCDILIFFLDGRVPDEGACVELGMAYAWNKICLGYKTDDRCLDFTGTDNLFIEGCMNFEISHNLNELKSKLECIKWLILFLKGLREQEKPLL